MAKPLELNLLNWNEMVASLQEESDRGTAVIACGFVDHFLGHYLTQLAKNRDIANELFKSTGPLSSFSQRIAIAYAYGFISKKSYDELNLIREIRNEFAHHPLKTTFATTKIAGKVEKLSMHVHVNDGRKTVIRDAFIISCGQFVVSAQQTLWRLVEEKQKAADKKPEKEV